MRLRSFFSPLLLFSFSPPQSDRHLRVQLQAAFSRGRVGRARTPIKTQVEEIAR